MSELGRLLPWPKICELFSQKKEAAKEAMDHIRGLPKEAKTGRIPEILQNLANNDGSLIIWEIEE